jgi:uncharacterized cofD-like protein
MNTHETPVRVAFGAGGTGGANMGAGVVSAFEEAGIQAEVDIIVSTGDSGSCTGEIAELHGVPANGDARNVLGAVSGNAAGEVFKGNKRYGGSATIDTVKRDSDGLLEIIAGTGADMNRVQAIFDTSAELARDLPKGLEGYTLGGLVLTALQLYHGSTVRAVAEAGDWLEARARVIPVTDERHNLVLWDAGETVRGEDSIDKRRIVDPRNAKLWLEVGQGGPPPNATAEAIGSFTMSDVALFGNSSLFTSTLAVTGVQGIAAAVRAQGDREKPGALAALINLTEDRSTTGLVADDYLNIIQNALGRNFTHAFYNIDPGALPEGKVPVRCDERAVCAMGIEPIAAKLVAATVEALHDNDPIAHLRGSVVTDARAIVSGLRRHVLSGLARRVPEPVLA